MSLNDLFGSYPGRPDHPDFARLSEIILQQDGRSYDADFVYSEHLGRFVDVASIEHMSNERCRRLAAELPRELTMEILVAALGSAYLDGFMLGYTFHERKVHHETESTIIALLLAECTRISDRSENILNDWQGLVDSTKERAALLGIEWSDSFIPDYVRDQLYPKD